MKTMVLVRLFHDVNFACVPERPAIHEQKISDFVFLFVVITTNAKTQW